MFKDFCKFAQLNSNALKELTFIRSNFERWKEVEEAMEEKDRLSPDVLADMYIDLTNDLAFAQTHYPQSRITRYLNMLSSTLHNEIYQNKREKWSRIITFWTREVPETMYHERKLLLASFLIMVVSAIIGIISQAADPEFCRIILGDDYVDMTLENIQNGKPMAVYDGSNPSEMFLGITLNNVYVSFLVYVMGFFTSIATGWVLFQNGIMLGAFEGFFAQHNLLGESILAVFLHGTLEISAIIVAGAAGLALGNSWLFPKTYSRIVSLRRGARRGLKIVVGTVPLFIVAGFIEGFVTRHTELPDMLRGGFILLSLSFVIFYYIIYPQRIKNKQYGKK